MKSLKNLYIFLVLSLNIQAQKENGLVKWLTIKEAQELNAKQPKPIILDFYTDWCGWCKHMMKTTYSNPNIANYINTFFYPVKFNAETKDTVEYNGKIYKPTSPTPKTPHELALKFLGNSISYPSTIFIANNYEFSLLTQGYLEDKKIEPLLIYTVENVYKTTPYETFSQQFNKTFYDTAFAKVYPKTYPVKDIEKLQKKKAKKTIVHISSDFCNSCKVQTATTFRDSSIAGYLNKHYYFTEFNAETNDTVKFKGETFFKTPINGYPLHTFALKATNNRLQFPCIAILDEHGNPLDAVGPFLTAEALLPILKYYSEDKHKTMSWADYIKSYHQQKK